MAQNDVHSFCPHIGLASGEVIVGYAGTALKYSCSVFGAPVALTARCAGVAPEADAGPLSTSIVFPAAEWGGRDLDEVFPPKRYKMPNGAVHEQPQTWELLAPRAVDLKNMGQPRCSRSSIAGPICPRSRRRRGRRKGWPSTATLGSARQSRSLSRRRPSRMNRAFARHFQLEMSP